MKYIRSFGLTLIVIALLGGVGGAQTIRSNIVKTQPSYSAYVYFEECDAAIKGIQKRMERFDVLHIDTARHDPKERLRPFHDSVGIIGRLCIRKDMLDSLTVKDGAYIASVYHTLSWYDDEIKVLDQTLNALTPAERFAEIKKVLSEEQTKRPVNLRAIDYLYERYLRELPDTAYFENYWVRSIRCSILETVAHPQTSQCRQEVLAAVDAIPNLSDIPIPVDAQRAMMEHVLRVKLASQKKEGLDSLSHSTAAYIRHVKAAWAAVSRGTLGDPEGLIIGKVLPKFQAPYWFSSRIQPPFTPDMLQQSGPFSVQEPRDQLPAGKIHLLVHLRGSCNRNTPLFKYGRPTQRRYCEGIAAAVRRVIRDHPNVGVMIVSQTLGIIGDVAVLDKKKEAEVLADYFFSHYRLPGTLAVSETPFFRIDGVDRRRIDQPTAWEDALWQEAIEFFNGEVILIDQDGKMIMKYQNIAGPEEFELLEMIGALNRRNR